MAPRVLVIEDEKDLSTVIAYNLRADGLEVVVCDTGEAGIREATSRRFDLVVLDLMLPDMSGLDVCRKIKAGSATKGIPILIASARGEEVDRVVGLELGADDYVVKPFNLAELAARVRALLRRSSGGTEPLRVVESGNLRIDPKTHEVTLDGKALSLSPKEFALLHFLAQNPGQVFSRDTLLDRVWGLDAYVNSRTVDVHIHWLRERIEPDPSKPTRLITLRGIGYKFAG